MVEQIAAGSESAVVELYESLRSTRIFFSRQIGPDHAEDAYHDLILDLVAAIRNGNLRQPESLPAYAMAIARSKVCSHIRAAVRKRRELDTDHLALTSAGSESPEQLAMRSEREAIATRVLTALSAHQRETLIRFYLKGETEEEIRAAMGISHNQFRLLKSRAKKRYEELVRESINRVPCRKPVVSASGETCRQQALA
jgi:RNA polymerase sigma factor (sigma-70 family)